MGSKLLRPQAILPSHSYRDQSGELEEKEHTLGEEDKVWVEVRHMHMKDALDKLITDLWYSKLGHKNIKSQSYRHSSKFWQGIFNKVLCVVTSSLQKILCENCL